jgi:hypothetical protein
MALILIGFFVKDLIGHRIGKFIFLKDRDRSGKWKKVDPVQSCLGIILSLNKMLLFFKITVDFIFIKWYFLSRGAPPYFATEVSPICFRKLKFGKINKFLAPNDIYVKMSGRVRPAVPKSQNRGEPVCKWIILWHTAIFLLNWIISRLIFFKFFRNLCDVESYTSSPLQNHQICFYKRENMVTLYICQLLLCLYDKNQGKQNLESGHRIGLFVQTVNFWRIYYLILQQIHSQPAITVGIETKSFTAFRTSRTINS